MPFSLLAFPVVFIFKANNVVFAEIAARLYLDHFQRHCARILQAVFGAKRDIGGLILGQKKNLVATGNAGRARDHDPVFGAVVMHLQRECSAGIDGDALHLETLTGIDAFVATPRAVYLAVTDMLRTIGVLETAD